jgi:transcriptional antiterminator RfaH
LSLRSPRRLAEESDPPVAGTLNILTVNLERKYMNWYAIYTKPRAEDTTARLLENAGMEVLNPKLRTKKYSGKKYGEVIEQLFPCYLFAYFDPGTHFHMIKYTRGVRYIVGKENPIAVPPEIITAIKENLEEGVAKLASENFRRGDRILVREGPFKDFYGIFERKLSGRERAMILLDALYCKLEIESVSIKKA